MNAPVGEVGLRISQAAGPRGRLRAAAIAKRLVDLLICILIAPFALIIGAPIALVLRLDGGRVLYSQPRVGAHGRSFQCLKFRSMVRNADAVLAQHLASHPLARVEWQSDSKLRNDPRVTRVGKFLRRTSFDELPQLINVIRGDMSIVGPRPIIVAEAEKYDSDIAFYYRVRPGITGLWQVNGRNDRTFADRVRLDLHYADTWSISGDLMIMAQTLPAVLARTGVK